MILHALTPYINGIDHHLLFQLYMKPGLKITDSKTPYLSRFTKYYSASYFVVKYLCKKGGAADPLI